MKFKRAALQFYLTFFAKTYLLLSVLLVIALTGDFIFWVTPFFMDELNKFFGYIGFMKLATGASLVTGGC